MRSGKWSVQEKLNLRTAVRASTSQSGRVCWTQVSQILESRSALQCKLNFYNRVCKERERKNQSWSLTETLRLLAYASRFGRRWKLIAGRFYGGVSGKLLGARMATCEQMLASIAECAADLLGGA